MKTFIPPNSLNRRITSTPMMTTNPTSAKISRDVQICRRHPMVTFELALDQMIDHAMSRAGICKTDYDLLGDAMVTILAIARRGGFSGVTADAIEDMIVNNLGED